MNGLDVSGLYRIQSLIEGALTIAGGAALASATAAAAAPIAITGLGVGALSISLGVTNILGPLLGASDNIPDGPLEFLGQVIDRLRLPCLDQEQVAQFQSAGQIVDLAGTIGGYLRRSVPSLERLVAPRVVPMSPLLPYPMPEYPMPQVP